LRDCASPRTSCAQGPKQKKELRECVATLSPDVCAVLDRGFEGHTDFNAIDDTFEQWAIYGRESHRRIYLPRRGETMPHGHLGKGGLPALDGGPRFPIDGRVDRQTTMDSKIFKGITVLKGRFLCRRIEPTFASTCAWFNALF
jgi:hypothetical protein